MDAAELLKLKYGDLAKGGWTPRLRAAAGYLIPDDIYEITVSTLVTSETDWLDVGCGRDLFPTNQRTAEILAARCRSLTGIDPSPNILDNPLLHHREQCMVQDFHPGRRYDLITVRMVAEHITEPEAAVQALAGLTAPGGRVVIYTVNKWSPASLIAAATPLSFHHFVKRILWGTDERDTFPTVYKMNTRRTLNRLFSAAGYAEERFQYLDDVRSFQRFRTLNTLELKLWRGLKRLGVRYPENCLLGIYRAGSSPAP